ncbi:hypothetical protein BH09BAC1_BH09BAC1_04560 [soil metagenome]
MTERLQGSSIQISSILFGFAGFACGAITLAYYGKPTPADEGLWYFYLLCISSFFLGHLFFFRIWVKARDYTQIPGVIDSVLGFAIPMGLMLIPEITGIISDLPENTLVAYRIAEAYMFTLYVLGSLNLYMSLLLMRRTLGKTRIIDGFYLLLLVSALFLIIRMHAPYWVVIIFYTAGSVGVLYLTTRLNWISLVRRHEKNSLAIKLLVINIINILLVYEYVLNREHYFFSVYSNFPEAIYTITIGFSVVYGLMALLALLFYMPVADIVDQQTRELEGLMEISESARQRENVGQVFDRMFSAAMRDTESDAGWLWFKVDKQDALVKAKNVNLSNVNSFRDALEPIICDGDNPEMLDVPELQLHPELSSISNGFRSMLALPIISNKVELGMLCLFKNQTKGYNSHMASMAKTYVNFALNAYENQQVLEETLRNEHVLEEYKLARQIQRRLIPATLSGQNGWQAITFIEPSKEVGGDFYDSFILDENRTAVVIGDVSGNGMPAALHMAEIKGIFQSLTSFHLEPNQLIVRANDAIKACFEKNRFVTLTYLEIDKKERRFTYIRAGHCPILYYDSQLHEAHYIKDEGLGLGILKSPDYANHVHVYKRVYQQNDVLVLFTDGIDEAVDPRTKEAYGYKRLELSLVESARHEALDKVMKGMLADIRRHVKDNQKLDDMTLILFRFD